MHNQHLIDKMTARLKELKPCKVILFGSYARGNPTEDSDSAIDEPRLTGQVIFPLARIS